MLEFDSYTKELEEKLHKYCFKIANEIAKKADININSAIYPDANAQGRLRDAVVIAEETPDGARAIGMGQDMVFMEFGAGDGADHPVGTDFGFVPDSWSVTHSQQYHRFGKWWHNGVQYTNIPANACIYNAINEVKGQMQSIADEVFK